MEFDVLLIGLFTILTQFPSLAELGLAASSPYFTHLFRGALHTLAMHGTKSEMIASRCAGNVVQCGSCHAAN
jgi:hypothetical protein